jgi:hypothetical protein
LPADPTALNSSDGGVLSGNKPNVKVIVESVKPTGTSILLDPAIHTDSFIKGVSSVVDPE